MQSTSYPYENFYEMLVAATQKSPKKVAIFEETQKFRYRDILAKVDAFGAYLSSIGVQAGDRVGLIAPNSTEFVITVYAATKIGAVVVPINNMMKANEYEYIVKDSALKILVTSAQYKKEVIDLAKVSKIEKMVWIDEIPEGASESVLFAQAVQEHFNPPQQEAAGKIDDMAIIFYTSGTTGHPKGAMLSYKNLFSNFIQGGKRFKVTDKDRFIVYLPMFHAFTFTVMVMLPFYYRSSFVVVPKLLPFSNIIKQTLLKRVTVFLGVPDIYNALIRADLPWYFMWFNKIRVFISGASALSEDTLSRFGERFGRATMMEGYGLTETSPVASVNPLERQKPMSIGPALDTYEIKIVDDEMLEVPVGQTGELIVKGDCVMMGYLNNPEETEKTIINGWLRTGDIGKIDSEGYLYIVDRMKDIIISKGINIYPRQIEEELMKLPYVKLSAVIGVPDDNSTEVPAAYIELEDEVDPEEITVSQVKKDLKKVLANFKIPKHVHFVEALPKTATGKVLKRKIKEMNI